MRFWSGSKWGSNCFRMFKKCSKILILGVCREIWNFDHFWTIQWKFPKKEIFENFLEQFFYKKITFQNERESKNFDSNKFRCWWEKGPQHPLPLRVLNITAPWANILHSCFLINIAVWIWSKFTTFWSSSILFLSI